ncbi:MAG TPA: hypothetical protein VL485_14165 [Ktedonobacteraceae bacterium]|jgi:hypothetical protein|nr:hypothetical protein [Ktedonobacteraceae bacterium]
MPPQAATDDACDLAHQHPSVSNSNRQAPSQAPARTDGPHQPAPGSDPLRDRLERATGPGESLGNGPEAARQIGVLRGGGASDEHGRAAAHVCKMAGPGEAVTRDVADSGVQDRQRAAVGVLSQLVKSARSEQILR